MTDIIALTITFSQQGNTNGTTLDHEELTVRVESPEPELTQKNAYLVFVSEKGWSVDGLNTPESLSVIGKRVLSLLPKGDEQ